MADRALRRTVRRCTALAVLQLGAVAGAVFGHPGVDNDTFAGLIAFFLSAGALVYLVGSVFDQLSSSGSTTDSVN